MVLQKFYDYSELDYPQVAARFEDLEAPRSFLIDPTKVSSYAGANGVTQRILACGHFGAFNTGAAAGKVRALPRAYLADPLVASTTTVFNTGTRQARAFIAGDALAVIAPYAIWTVTGTWANTETGTITIDGRPVVFTATNSTLADIAAIGAAAVNADAILKQKVVAIASGAAIYVYAKDMQSTYPIATAETAASGTLPITGSATVLAAGASIGTVASVDVLADEITISAASSISLPTGFPIGVIAASPADSNGQGYGLFAPKVPIDLAWGADTTYGAYVEGTFYRDRLPYWDGELARLFPDMVLV